MKKFLLVLILLQSMILYAQESFYIKDTITNIVKNLVLVDPVSNAKYCHLEFETKMQKLTPEEVDKYCVDGRCFFSKMVDIRGKQERVFLEKLSEGKIDLYYYEDYEGKIYYYTKGDQNLKPVYRKLNGKKYKDVIIELTKDLPEMKSVYPRLRFNRNNIKKAINYYNNEKVGFVQDMLIGGYIVSGISKNKHPRDMFEMRALEDKLSFDSYFGGAIFLNIPLNLSKSSLYIELQFSKISYKYKASYPRLHEILLVLTPGYYKLDVSNTSIDLPLMYRYNHPGKNGTLFAQTGLTPGINITDKAQYYYEYINGDIKEYNPIIYDKFQFGYSLGLGFTQNIGTIGKISGEIRYNIKGLPNQETFYIHQFAINLGYIFH